MGRIRETRIILFSALIALLQRKKGDKWGLVNIPGVSVCIEGPAFFFITFINIRNPETIYLCF